MDDYISRQAAIDVLERQAKEMSRWAERLPHSELITGKRGER